MAKLWLVAGALCCALAVVAGAFGAHALEKRLDQHSLALWETAARYLMFGALGLLAIGLVGLQRAQRVIAVAGALELSGALLFSTTVAILALGGPRWLGAVTPLGGLMMIGGFVALAWAAWQL